jgi:predicted TIM-barrel fold metal-dependent hydrolase
VAAAAGSHAVIVDKHHHLWRVEDGYRWLDEAGRP